MNKDLDITPFPSVKEFAIGAMLPQYGSREGMSSDKRNILEVLLDDEEYMKETSFSDVKKIVDSFSREDLLKFSPSGRFVNSPNCIYRNVIKVGKYGGFIEVYKMSNSKNVGFISIAVQNEAQGNGIGTRLVNEMISNISGIDTLVWRCEKNNNASNNLAKKCGFKLSSETKNTNTYKLQLHNIEEYMKESYIFNENDYVINMDKWKPGVPLFITGASGDGKTTLSLKLAKENNAIILHGDVLLARLKSKDKNSWDAKVNEIKTGTGKEGKFIIDNRGLSIFFDYINTHNLPYGISLYDENNISKYFNNFIEWLIQTLPTNPRTKNYKYILESCNICLADPELISKFPLIISGTSRLTSLIRRAKRRTETHNVSFINALFGNIKKYNLLARKLDDNKDFFKTNIELLNINESGTSSDVDRIINTFTKDELKEFAPKGNPENHSNNVIYRDVKKVNGVPVAFIEVDQYPDDKKNNECNISVGCDPKYRGNGYTKELLSKFIKTQGHKYNKIWYGYKKTNIGSKKLVESIGGFKNVGGKEGMEWQTLEIKESVETLLTTNPFEPVLMLYHGSNLKLKEIHPMGKNFGTKISKIRTSSFWTPDYNYAFLFAIFRLLREKFKVYFDENMNFMVRNTTISDINNFIKNRYIYIYTKVFDKKYLGIGHDPNGEEFTIDIAVEPDKVDKYPYNKFKNTLFKKLRIMNCSDEEFTKIISNTLNKLNSQKKRNFLLRSLKEMDYMNKNIVKPYQIGLVESALSADDRNNIKTKDFGLPDQRKYPMPDKEHVLLAIKFFNYCPAKDKDELAKNIIEKIDYYFDEGEKMNIKIGDKNSFKKYWDNSINESCNINEGYFSDLNIELEEYGEPILDDYKYTNKPTQDGFIDKRGTWGSILKYKNNYFRERVEALIIDGNKIFLAFIPDGVNNNFYKVPGGSSEKDGSLTDQLQNECNEEAKIKIKNPKYILSYMMKYPNGDYISFVDPKRKYYGAITHLYIAEYNGRYTGIVDEVDLSPKILKYGRFYKINEIFEKLRPVHKVALLSKDNKYKVKTENVVENTYFKLDYDNMEAFYEEVLHKQDLYPVFICSFEYESSYKKIIKAFTGSRFTHSGISFNAKLSEIFSFVKEAVSGDHVGGFYIEDIKDVKLSNYNNSIKIDVVFVNKKQYDKMQKFIRKLYYNINNSNYNTMNLLNIAFNKPTTVNEMNMVCSTFVAYIFEIAGIKLVDNKDTTLVTPADIASTEKKYIHTLFNDKGMNLDLRQINKNLVFTYNKLYNDKYNLNTSYLTNRGFYK